MKKTVSILIVVAFCFLFSPVYSTVAQNSAVSGDINGDKCIDPKDMLLLKKHIVRLITLDNEQILCADVNRDNVVNLTDILLLRKHLAGLLMLRNGNNYYISKSGNDNNTGTIESPFLTIQKAASVALPGDTCYIRAGVYNETVKPLNSGNNGLPITFCAYNGEKAVVSGTQSVNTDWSYYKDGIYKTNLKLWRNDDNQIFVDGEMAQLCRYPNKNTDDFLSVGDTIKAHNASESFADFSAETFGINELSGSKIAIMGTNNYLYWSSTVTKNTSSHIEYKNLNSSWDSPTSNSKFYVYDKLNLLDFKNEWYYDDATTTLYYKPGENVDINKLNIEYSVRGQAFDVSNKSNITIKGLTIFGAGIKNNSGSQNLTIDSNKILYYYHTNVLRSYPWEADWWGVELHGNSSRVVNNEIAYGAEAGIVVYADNCSVVNNYIHDINYNNSNAAAIEPRRCEYTLIKHNTIKNTARSAIVANSKNTRICYNNISNCGVNTSDVSGIGTYKFDAQNTVEIDHNVIHDTKNKKMFVAYYLDNGSLNFLVHHNVAYNVDNAMTLNNPSYNNKIYNNTFVKCGPISTGNLQNPFENNAFIGSVWTGDEFYNNIIPDIYYGDGALFSNNLFCYDKNIKFSDYQNNDFTLLDNSVALNNGVATSIESDCNYIGAYGKDGEFFTGADMARNYECIFSLSSIDINFKSYDGLVYDEIKKASGANLLNKSIFYDNLKIQKGWAEQIIDVTPGEIYYYSCNARFDNPIKDTYLEFGVHFLDSGYNIASQGGFLYTQSEFNNLTTIFMVPNGCYKMRCFAACWADQMVTASDFKLIKIEIN